MDELIIISAAVAALFVLAFGYFVGVHVGKIVERDTHKKEATHDSYPPIRQAASVTITKPQFEDCRRFWVVTDQPTGHGGQHNDADVARQIAEKQARTTGKRWHILEHVAFAQVETVSVQPITEEWEKEELDV